MKQLFLASIIFLLISISANAQKISKEAYNRLYGTPEEWSGWYDKRETTAPPEIKEEIASFNSTAPAKGYTFRIGYTTVYDANVKLITGARLPDANYPERKPDPQMIKMPLRGNVIRLTTSDKANAVDMRDYGIVTRIQNQLNCGSCWAFATVAALETSSLLKNGGDAGVLNLSEQQVVNCAGPSSSCNTGFVTAAAEFMMNHSISLENYYLYTGKDSICGMGDAVNTLHRARRWGTIDNTIADIKLAVMTHGSITVAIWADGPLMRYRDGVYNYHSVPQGAGINHCVQIIGWNDELQAWLIKNSWGPNWGMGGFGWIRYGINNIGWFPTWIEAESYGTMAPVTNNPHVSRPLQDYYNASYTDLEALYAGVRITSIRNRQSQKLLDVDDGTLSGGLRPGLPQRIIQWQVSPQINGRTAAGANQRWLLLRAGESQSRPTYKLFNTAYLGLLADNLHGKPTLVHSKTHGGSNPDMSQLWYIIPQENKFVVKFKNAATGNFLEIQNGNSVNGGEFLMNTESDSDNQVFIMDMPVYDPMLLPDARFRISPSNARDFSLDLTAGNTATHTPVQLWQNIAGNINQAWKVDLDSDIGYVKFHPGKSPEKTLQRVLQSSYAETFSIEDDYYRYKNQMWLLFQIPREPGKYIIFDSRTGRVLQAPVFGVANGMKVNVVDFINGENQKWILQKFR